MKLKRSYLIKGLVAGCLALGITACGGGGEGGIDGSQAPAVNTKFEVFPGNVTAYVGSATTFTVQGGVEPINVSLDDPALATLTRISQREFVLRPNHLDSDATATISVQDSQRLSVTTRVTIKQATIVNRITVTPEVTYEQSTCGASICTGLTALVTAELKAANAGGLTNRNVKFDAVDGAFDFLTNDGASTAVRSVQVPVDRDGKAVVRIRVRADATNGIALMRITDLATSNSLTSSFGIVRVVSGQGVLSSFPDSATYRGEYDDVCAKDVGSSFYVYGGKPPYSLRSDLGDALKLSTSTITSHGGGVSTVLSGQCFDRGVIVVTDANGRAMSLNTSNITGSKKRPVVPASDVAVTLLPEQRRLGCGEVSSHFVLGGGQRLSDGTSTKPQFRVVSGDPSLVQVQLNGDTLTIGRSNVGGTSTSDISAAVYVNDGAKTQVFYVQTTGKCPA
jgi:hypothetical protein